MPGLLSVDDALRLIEARAQPLASRQLPLAETLGLVLAEEIASDVDSPPHDKAMMDGFAVRSVDGDADRVVIEEVFAGDVPTREVGPCEATRIMTGAPLPAGADCVVPVELTTSDAASVQFDASPVAGKHVARRGEVMRAGDEVLSSGSVIRSAEVALLAEVGKATVRVVPRPRVAVLPTGAELVSAGQMPGPGQIRNSNGPMLQAAVQEAGGAPIDAGVTTDDETALRTAILAARHADVLLLSGGVSAGDKDLAPGVLAELGVECVLHKVAVKPGKPLWFGVWPPISAPERPEARPTYVFGLPGNPVSSFVTFQLFVRPLLEKLSGRRFSGLQESSAVLATDITHRGGRETYLPARLIEDGAVEPVPWRGSADLVGLAAADALIRLPIEPREYARGQRVNCLGLRTAWSGTNGSSEP